MGIQGELRQQARYLRDLTRCIGLRGALEWRLRQQFRSRGEESLVRMQPGCLRHEVALRVGTSDAMTYRQVLVAQEYGVLADLDPEVIVDCGANVGYTSAFLLEMFPRARLVAIEPSPGNAALCRRNLASYGDRVRLIEAGVWSRSCRLVVEARRGDEWGVKVREAGPGEAGDVDAVCLADLGLPRIDLLKVDIEGSEAVIFRDGVEAWLPKVGALAIELHGPDCEAAFEAALAGYHQRRQLSGELVILRDLRPAPARAPEFGQAGRGSAASGERAGAISDQVESADRISCSGK
ncbi:FkbM family methyltransferase [Siccirubricoccus sp. KC 17139]|uniref:FkbM family methyltransferase n=1 Tax=Siccirubricoccus soli TaxID=2899147 RepID=A0ABT1D3R7_9PROT|nr:FkbM family methyltransferase [Siccirubricoccus soli]MCO6415620.1 FkbM family methyltransferase [Siccirubricoccus soli]MCP2681752.1 FkbM family methyltransferase [Siccirubricoccus soli]